MILLFTLIQWRINRRTEQFVLGGGITDGHDDERLARRRLETGGASGCCSCAGALVMFFPALLDVRHGDPAPGRDLQRSGQSAAHRLGLEQFHRRVEPHAVPDWTWNSLVIAIAAVVITVVSTCCAAMPSPSSVLRAATSCSSGCSAP